MNEDISSTNDVIGELSIIDEKDPDYQEFHEKQQIDRSKIQENISKEETIEKIENILNKQFSSEIEYKVNEIDLINDRIQNVQSMLDRLRAYVVASYYGSGEKIIPVAKSIEKRKRKINQPPSNIEDLPVLPINTVYKEKLEKGEIEEVRDVLNTNSANNETRLTFSESSSNSVNNEIINRFYLTKKIIVGNVSKYLLSDSRKENDKSTHKWMVYVRGPAHEPDISYYIKAVWFFLHPSYIPNDIVQVNKPPFQITRRGWGEFPVRVQLHFKDGRNKRFDIIHNLKLDKTYTGLQTLGAETVVNLELHRHTKSTDELRNKVTDSHLSNNNNTTQIKKEIHKNTENSKSAINQVLEKPFLLKPTSLKINTPFSADKQTNFSESLSLARQNSIDSIMSTDTDFTNAQNSSVVTVLNANSSQHSPFVAIPNALFQAISSHINTPSAVSSCVTSASISRCASPEYNRKSKTKKEKISITDEQDTLLRKLVPFFPIINPRKNVLIHSYSCVSFDVYKACSFSKRRACEWQRALSIRDAYAENLGMKFKSIPSIKEIMIWCRYNNFTPSENKINVVDHRYSVDFHKNHCTHCGKWLSYDVIVKNENEVNLLCNSCQKLFDQTYTFSTRSLFTDVLDEIQNKEKTVTSLKKLESARNMKQNLNENDDIDVIGSIATATVKSFPVNTRYEISSSDELDWVYEICLELGIHLPTSMHKNVKGPFSSMILLAAMKHFASELLRKSHSEAVQKNKYSFNPGMVTVTSVSSTLTKVKKFDFLLESGLGKTVEETETTD